MDLYEDMHTDTKNEKSRWIYPQRASSKPNNNPDIARKSAQVSTMTRQEVPVHHRDLVTKDQ